MSHSSLRTNIRYPYFCAKMIVFQMEYNLRSITNSPVFTRNSSCTLSGLFRTPLCNQIIWHSAKENLNSSENIIDTQEVFQILLVVQVVTLRKEPVHVDVLGDQVLQVSRQSTLSGVTIVVPKVVHYLSLLQTYLGLVQHCAVSIRALTRPLQVKKWTLIVLVFKPPPLLQRQLHVIVTPLTDKHFLIRTQPLIKYTLHSVSSMHPAPTISVAPLS